MPTPNDATQTVVFSVVAPLFNEQQSVAELYNRLIATLEGEGSSFELVLVDDGSHDSTLALLSQLAASDPRVRVIALARNFGHQAAISAGLDYARGQAVIVMDGDLQDPPEVLPALIAQWRAGHQVVYAVRQARKEHWLLRGAYAAFYRGLQRLASVPMPLDAGDFCLIDRRVVDILRAMPERNRFLRGLRSWVGFSQVGVPYERQARAAGRSKYTLRRLMALALDGILSFSRVPLHLAIWLGFAISISSFLIAIFYVVKRLFFHLAPPGFATLAVAIFFLSGVQLLTVGLIGEYIGRIFEEVKQRPLYVVRQVLGEPHE